MNASPEAQLRLLDLQAVDTAIDQLVHRRRTLPDHATVAALEQRERDLADSLVDARTIHSDASREQAKADADVEAVRARRARDQERLDSGRVGSPRELESLQHEVESLARRQGDLEDVELEVMERVEAAAAEVARIEAEQVEVSEELAHVTERRDTALASVDRSLAERRAEREALAADVPAELRDLYERVRASSGGIGAAALHRGACQGCRLSLNANDLRTIKAAAPDAVVRCEECRRILVRTAESGL